MKKVFIALATVGLLSALIWAVCSFCPRTYKATDYAMNTVVTITVKSTNPKADARMALQEVKRIDALMSATRSSSDVGRINSAAHGTRVRVSREVYSLIDMSLDISRKTDGAFDISINPLAELWNINSPNPGVPADSQIKAALSLVSYKDIALDPADSTVTLQKPGMSINLGAIAKGYAADSVAKILTDRGVSEAIVDLGGNVYVVGKEKTIGIQAPFKPRGAYFDVCKASDTSVVTSGAYERYFKAENGKIYHHILDPHTGYPAQNGIKSSTVICKSSALADGLSTAFYVLGESGAREVVSGFEGVEVILLTDKDRIVKLSN